MTEQTPVSDNQAEALIDLVQRATSRNRALLLLVQYNHEADKLSFLNRIGELAKQQDLATRSYDPLNHPEHGAGQLYPLLETDAKRDTLSLVVSMAREPDSDQLEHDFLSYINFHRDKISQHKLRFVLFLRESEMLPFMTDASDLWSFRQTTFWLERELESQGNMLWQNMEGLTQKLKLSAEEKLKIEAHIEQIHQLNDESKDKQDKAQLLHDLAQWLVRQNAPTLAAEAAIEGIDLLNNVVCDLLGDLENDLGFALRKNGHNAEALTHYKKSLVIRQQLEDKQGEGVTLNSISTIYYDQGNYDIAVGYLQRSLVIRQEVGDKMGEGVTLNNISQIYDAKGDYDTALSYLQRSLTTGKDIGDEEGEGITLNNISQIYDVKGDYDTALSYLHRALVIQQEIADKMGEGVTLNNISSIYQAKGDYDTALSYLQRALIIQESIGDKAGEGTTLNNTSLVYGA
ncbi:MAG: tetratricopeptide (TPR) repeat protein, partial [Phenylobacterium sp.]